MSLETMQPDPVWNAQAHADVVGTLSEHADVTYRVWGGDWCGDCRSLLPPFAAALDAADVPDEHIEQYPVDQDKQGEGVDAYGIEYIPTVVVERDGTELARFVEDEGEPIARYLAHRLDAAETTP